MSESGKKPHAIVISYPLQGHVIPGVHLAIKLASKGFTITYINTQYVHNQITTGDKTVNGQGDIFAEVRKRGLDIRYTTVCDGLPLDFDRSLNHDQFFASLLHVFSAHVEEAVKKILKSGPPVDCLIADTFFVWPGSLAKKYGLVYVSFWTEPALVFSLYYNLDVLRFNGHFGCIDLREDPVDYLPGVGPIEPKDLPSYVQEMYPTSVVHQIIFKAFKDAKQADFVLCNTVQELESGAIAALNKTKPFYAIGPIFPTGFTKSCVATSLWSESDCAHWLDTKPPGSVLYVSFGSYAHMKKNDLHEIANGILESQISFVWVLRPDIVSAEDQNPLPDGFRAASGERGMIIPWCCQITVLNHPAIGGSLTHCGWNSILESIWCGVPLLCFPLLTDQFTNRKLVVDDWKIGMNLCDRVLVTSGEVSRKVKCLMSNKSDELKKGIKRMKDQMEKALGKDGSSEKNLDQCIAELTATIEKKKGSVAGG
ncbi:OLC1v1003812C1 [Oldenlandia corymbosa var. corymbosa]|uniref:OLC1v1003812C1 n=1 Tax=Oldenlandia corymbosa var. corymbosa TaxID=529605 RepID=A0AAV1DAV4_OLDCO|nr:OLC1v1003812C1 [Oldenlandia corymbosa var. corymbosa]